MASKITIAYAGTLSDYGEYKRSLEDSQTKPGIRGAVQTYRNINVDWSSRTGYYIIHAAKVFKEKYPHLIGQLEILIWGSISKGNAELANELGVDDIVKIDAFIPHHESIKRMEAADYALIPLETEKNGQKPIHIPGKIYEFLNLEKKMLVLAEDSDCRDIAEQSGLAVFAKPNDPENIADTMKSLIENPPQLSANREFIDKFDYTNLAKGMAKIFKSL